MTSGLGIEAKIFYMSIDYYAHEDVILAISHTTSAGAWLNCMASGAG